MYINPDRIKINGVFLIYHASSLHKCKYAFKDTRSVLIKSDHKNILVMYMGFQGFLLEQGRCIALKMTFCKRCFTYQINKPYAVASTTVALKYGMNLRCVSISILAAVVSLKGMTTSNNKNYPSL